MKKPVVLLQIFLVATLLSAAQEAKTTTSKPASKPAQSPKQSQKKNAKPEPPPLTKVQPEDVLAHLEQSIAWYRQVRAAEQLSGVPSDLVVRDVTMNRALQSLQLAFDFARAEAAFLAAEKRAANPAQAVDDGNSGRSLTRAATNAAARVADVQLRLDAINAKLGAKPKNRDILQAEQDEMEAQLVLAKQVDSTIRGMLNIVGDGSYGSTNAAGLLGQIATLERSVPEARHLTKNDVPPPSKPAVIANSLLALHPDSEGLVTLTTEYFTLDRASSDLDELLDQSDALVKNIDRLKAPLLTILRTSIQRSQTMIENSSSQSIGEINSDRREIESLTLRFKQLSTATVPVGEQQLLVEAVRTNLTGWRNSIDHQRKESGKYLLLRVGTVLLVILLVLGVSTVWNRATIRYIADIRRRRQFTVLRRVAVAFAIGITVVLGFVTDFSSIATYAGFLTAGLALGLQNVILSVVAYFFLIGKYGVKVGDRVTISGVTGEVIDIGLVRMYMMELAGTGREMHPTGRTVVYANSIVFQPSALFKQVPGADYAWHTAALTLLPETDYKLAENTLMDAVTEVYREYRAEIEMQHQAFQKSVQADIEIPEPDCYLSYVEAGLEFRVRYPADSKRAAAIDEQVLKALRDAVEATPELKTVTAPKVV